MERAICDDDVVIVVVVGVDAIRDFVSVNIALPLDRTPAVANIGLYVDDFERREKSVFNAFFQTVAVNGVTKVIEVGDIFGFLRRSRHADLCRGIEIVEDFSPAAFFFC